MLTNTQRAEAKEIAKALKTLDNQGLQLTAAVVSCLLARQKMSEKAPKSA